MTETDRHNLGATSLLAAALAAVQAELPAVRKGETGEIAGTTRDGRAYKYNYRYADLASVAQAIMPLLGKNGLSFTAWTVMTDAGFILRYSLLHESGEHLDGEWPLPKDATPQQLGSHITYARRYSLCAVTGVAPDEDDDAAAAEAHARQRPADNTPSHGEPDMAKMEEALDIMAAATDKKEMATAWKWAGGYWLHYAQVPGAQDGYTYKDAWKDRMDLLNAETARSAGLGEETGEPQVAPAATGEEVQDNPDAEEAMHAAAENAVAEGLDGEKVEPT
jgi:hypothetical protein